MKTIISFVLHLGFWGLLTTLILGWGQSLHPALDSFSIFRFQFGGLFAVATLLILFLNRRLALIGVLVLVISAILSLPHLPGLERGRAVASVHQDKPKLRVAQFNLLFENYFPQTAINVLNSSKADVILLQEISKKTEAILAGIKEAYPYQLNCRQSQFHGPGLVSRLPIVSSDFDGCDLGAGTAHATINWNETLISVVSFHAHWPWPRTQWLQIDMLADNLSKIPAPLILGGDFNATPWSASVQRIASLTGAKVPAGLHFTWKPGHHGEDNALPRLLSLDQIMHTEEFGLLSRTILPHGGSDHSPLVNEFVLLN